MEKMTQIAVRGEFSFRQCLLSLPGPSKETLYTVEDDKVFRAVRTSGGPVLIELRDDGENKPEAGVTGEGNPEEALGFVRQWFDLDYDPDSFYRMAAGDDILAGLQNDYRGLRLIGIPDLFEALCWSIIGQQINMAFAYKLKRNFVERFGEKYFCNGREFNIFPLPEVVASSSPAEIAEGGISRQKSRYIFGAAEEIASGRLNRKMLDDLKDFDEAKKRLITLKGVGDWTADYVLMKNSRYPEALPAGDAGLQNALKKRLGAGEKPSPAEIREMGKRWGSHKAYAVFYLWRSLSDG